MPALTTRLLTLTGTSADTALIAEAAAILRSGGLVALPTETVYGLGGDALNPAAVARIFAAKQRPAHDPLIVHVADPAGAAQVVTAISPLAATLMAHFWPGPLTLVLPGAACVPLAVTAGGPTVAVRCPAHPVARALIAAAGTPVAAPSANRFSHTSPTTAAPVWHDLAGRIEAILDGGPTPIGVESTVVACDGDDVTILRPGGVTAEALAAVIGRNPRIPLSHPAADGVLPAPGLLERHYAPRTPLLLIDTSAENLPAALAAHLAAAQARGQRVALLVADEDAQGLGMESADFVASLGPAGDLPAIARALYSALRDLDSHAPDVILARTFPPHGLGHALNDRLRRAAWRVVAG
jgi:L-threonylcarbamoyladenylate synthase